jgi:hypothetical protein
MHIYTGLNLEVWSKIAGLVIEGAGEREGKRKGVGIKCHVISNGKLGMGQLVPASLLERAKSQEWVKPFIPLVTASFPGHKFAHRKIEKGTYEPNLLN